MKRLLALSILLAALSFSFMGTFSWAEESEKRNANPGIDPNESSQDGGAHVVAYGTGCPTCARRTYPRSIHSKSVPRGGANSFKSETGKSGTTSGTN